MVEKFCIGKQVLLHYLEASSCLRSQRNNSASCSKTIPSGPKFCVRMACKDEKERKAFSISASAQIATWGDYSGIKQLIFFKIFLSAPGAYMLIRSFTVYVKTTCQ